MEPVRIEWLQPDGRGAGRGPDGMIVVAGAVPGDLVAVRVVTRRGRTVEGEVEAMVEASPERRAPPCPWDAACGGCDLAAIRPEARLARLAHLIGHTLELPTPPEVVPSPRPTAHRARVKLAIDRGRVGYRAHRSHDLVEPGTCAVARPELQEALVRLRDPRHDAIRAAATSVELRSDGARAVYAFEGGPPPGGLDALGDVAWNGRAVAGDPTLQLQVDGASLRAGPRSFYQVNLEANALLVAHVVAEVVARRPERVLDLYAGIGNLTLPLARATGVPVTAVELDGDSVSDLRHNAAGHRIEVFASRVERYDVARSPFDALVLDPPRAGTEGQLPRFLALRPRVVVLVACDVRSARRDTRDAIAKGYRVAGVRGFDLFPDTHHVETVVVLERR